MKETQKIFKHMETEQYIVEKPVGHERNGRGQKIPRI
jgi:hypothetical protein